VHMLDSIVVAIFFYTCIVYTWSKLDKFDLKESNIIYK